MGKGNKLPTIEQFIQRKVLYDPKKEPPWIFLEKDMLANLKNKPYNEKVGKWCRFLKDLKFYYYCEAKKQMQMLQKEAGPTWFIELSMHQQDILRNLRSEIHKDLLTGLPCAIRRVLHDLGFCLRIPKNVLMSVMEKSLEDPGLFMWYLYEVIYKVSPVVLQKKYDINSMLLMSSMVFIDLKKCIKELEKLTEYVATPKPAKVKKQKNEPFPDVRYGCYLDKQRVKSCYEPSTPKKQSKPPPLGCKLMLQTDEDYEALRLNVGFLEQRKQLNVKIKDKERICTYKFWEPPISLISRDPKQAKLLAKFNVMKKKPKKKFTSPIDGAHYNIAGVSYSGDVPNYIIANVVTVASGYIPINGGTVIKDGNYIMNVTGFWKYPMKISARCKATCGCGELWEETTMDYINKSKCKCQHLYDFYQEGKCKEPFFHRATRQGPPWFDEAQIYRMDPTEDFVKECVEAAERSRPPTPEIIQPTLSSTNKKLLLRALLSELSNTTLLIPHLPEANKLNNLLEWVRQRTQGKLTPEQKRNHKLHSERRWLDLKHLDFRARSYIIPFKLEELERMTWQYRDNLKDMNNILLDCFVKRNRLSQVEQSRLWWSTTKHDAYPSKPFVDTFFAYMPGRIQDTHIIEPYNPFPMFKENSKTCPLRF